MCAILYWYRLTLKLLMQLKQTKTIKNLQHCVCSRTRLLILLTERKRKFVEFRRQQKYETHTHLLYLKRGLLHQICYTGLIAEVC